MPTPGLGTKPAPTTAPGSGSEPVLTTAPGYGTEPGPAYATSEGQFVDSGDHPVPVVPTHDDRHAPH